MLATYLSRYTKTSEEEYAYKLCVFYHAKTEIFDRGLTDLRSKYDSTEAYITGDIRKYSNSYAFSLYQYIRDIAKKLKLKDINNFNNYHYSAQGWIDEYYRLKELGEMDFIEKLVKNNE